MTERTTWIRVEATLLLAAFLAAPRIATAAEAKDSPAAPDGIATSQAAPATDGSPGPASARTSPPASGLLFVRDPETGALRRATAAEIEKLDRQKQVLLELTGRATPPAIVVHRDGTREARLPDGFGLVAVARRGPGGKVEVGCFSNPSKAAEFTSNVVTEPSTPNESPLDSTRAGAIQTRHAQGETKGETK